MRTTPPTSEHERVRQAVLAVVRKEAADMPGEQVLAIMANITGGVLALLDQRRFTPDQAMEIISANIEAGNRAVIDELMRAPGGRA